MPRGVNVVEKSAPFYPAATAGDDDAALSKRGFNTVRLGVVFEALMPQPGRRRGVHRTPETVRSTGTEFCPVDFHQDGWGLTHGNGMPAATLTDGVPNLPAEFPLYYVLNPAIQRVRQLLGEPSRAGRSAAPREFGEGDGRSQRFAHIEHPRLRSDERALARRELGALSHRLS
jgi:hypothetical protein